MNRALTVGLIGVICLCLGGVLVSPVSAGDRTGTADLVIDEKEVDSGDTVTVTLSFFSDGGYGGEGLVEIWGAIEYDEAYLTVEEATYGPFFDDDGAETNATVTDTDGTVQFELNRIPSDEGTVGQGVLISLTLAVADDAGPANADVSVSSLSAELIDDIPLNTYTLNADQQLAIDGGVADGDNGDGDSDGDPDGVTLADDPPEDDPTTDGADADTDATDDADANRSGTDAHADAGDSDGVLAAVPAVAVVAVLSTLVFAGVVAWRRFAGDHNG